MKVPLRLTRRADPPAAAEAVLLFAADAGPLARACEQFGGTALPAVYPVRGGFLLVPPRELTRPVPGTVRLRRLSGDLYIPADANLSPAFLPDEMAALTRDRGLVVLPGGDVLAFDPGVPLPVSRWLAPPRVSRGAWEPFPSPPPRAEQLTLIERPAAPDAVAEILSAGRPDGADPLPGAGEGSETGAPNIPEDARPPAGSLARRVAAGAGLGAGQFLTWLGRMLALPGLARLGGDLARRMIEQVPRLTEKLLGAQEAALRELLHQLQEGDVEKALRRAPAAVSDPDRPARVGTTADLGYRDPRYSLRDLIAGAGGGAGVAWYGGGDVWQRLAQEYRRLAQEAVARGDHRRAAYLYGALLRDLRAAANALLAGGLFHDAGILLRDRLKDDAGAAAAFEQAGDYDEALRLYDRVGRFEQAGELLKKLGDDARAADYFARAADRLADQGKCLAAGDLVRTKAGDRAAADRYYRRGWEGTGAETIACGERLLDGMLVAEDWGPAAALLAEAEGLLAPPRGAADAGRFFNYAITVGADFLPAELRDDLADRARRLFAAHLRAGGRPAVADVFTAPGVWPGPVVRDATFAARDRPRRPTAPPHDPPVQLARGTVTAVGVARETFDLVVATTTEVVLWRVAEGQGVPVCQTHDERVLGLSADPAGRVIYVLRTAGDELQLQCLTRGAGGLFGAMGQCFVDGWDGQGGWHLEPTAVAGPGGHRVTLAGPTGRTQMTGWFLQAGAAGPFLPDGSDTHLLVRDGTEWTWDWADRAVRCLSGEGELRHSFLPYWAPGIPPGGSLAAPRLDWITPIPGVLEVAGVDSSGGVHWSEFDARSATGPRSKTASVTISVTSGGFLAACLIAPGILAAATVRNEIHWLRVTAGQRFRPWGPVRTLSAPARPVALVSRPCGNEVVAVLEDGSAIRVPKP